MSRKLSSLRDIVLFVAAYEEKSFTAAASRENATQSGVSQHLKKLELSLGVALFYRDGGRVEPTPAGDLFYSRCIETLRSHEEADRAVKLYAKGLEGEVNAGLMPTLTRKVLAPALESFMAAHPNAHLRLVEGYSGFLVEQVQKGLIDFAVTPSSLLNSSLLANRFATTREVLVSGSIVGLRNRQPLRLADLSGLKLIVPGRGNARRQSIDAYLAANRVSVRRVLELDTMMATLSLISSSDWVAILPGVMMVPQTDDLVVNPIVDPILRLDLSLVQPRRKPLTGVAEVFVTILRQETLRLANAWEV